MISQAPISAAPISIILEHEDKDVFYFVNCGRTVFVKEELRAVYVPEELRTVYVRC